MNEIIVAQTDFSKMMEYIENIPSIEEVLKCVKRIDALKSALQAADVFHKQSVKYAKLEASALIRAVELGGLLQIRAYHRDTAKWLFNLSAQEREKYISMCEDGLTINQIYKREVGNEKKLSEKISMVELQRNALIDECKKTGMVDVSVFSKMTMEAFNYDKRSIANDIIDGARNRLRTAGAVGIGDGVYVMPNPENSDKIKEALLLRYKSICADFQSMKEIARASKVKMSYKEFDDGSNWSYNNQKHVINILMALCDMRIISDVNDCVAAIDKTLFCQEISGIQKKFGISRKEYIKLKYEKYFGENAEKE